MAQLSIQLGVSGQNLVEGALKGLQGALTGLGGAVTGPARALAGAGDVVGKLVGSLGAVGLAAGGLKAIGGSLAGVATGMVAGNAEMERYETQLGTLLGSAGAAKERLAELAKFGATTPFELPEVVRAEKVLLGFGLTGQRALDLTGKSATELRTVIGDIAAGTGASFEEIALSFGKFGAGATGESISRLQELGVVTREQLTAMGIQFSKSGELTSPLPQAMAAAVQIAQQKFGGGMEKLSQTFEGQMSNLSDSFNQAKNALTQPIFEALKPQLVALNNLLSSGGFQDGLKATAATLSGVVAGGVGLAVDAFQRIQPAIAPVLAVLPDLGRAVQQAAGFFLAGLGDVEVFRAVLNRLIGPDGAQVVMTVFTNLSGFFREVVAPAFQSIAGIAQKALSGDLVGALSALGAHVATFTPRLVESLAGWGRAFLEWIGPMIPPLLAEAQRLAGQLLAWTATQVGPLTAQLQVWGQQLWAWIAPMIPPLLERAGQLAGQLLAWIGAQANVLLGRFQSDWGPAAWQWVQQAATDLVPKLGDLLLAAVDWIGANGPGIATAFLTEWVPAAVAWVAHANEVIIPKLVEFVASIVTWLVTTGVPKFLEWGDALQIWFRDILGPKVGAAGLAVGKAIIAGIIAGAQSVGETLSTTITNLVNQAISSAKRALGIASPSRRFAEEVGEPMVAGIIVGLQAGGAALEAATRGMLGRATSAARAEMLDLAGVLGGTARDAVAALQDQLDSAGAAMVGLGDQVAAAEAELAAMQGALKPLQQAFDASKEKVDSLKSALGDLQSQLSTLGGGGVLLPGEHEADQTIFGLQNAINILKAQRLELLRSGVAADDPQIEAIEERIRANEQELEYRQAKRKADYDGQRNALREAAEAGTKVTATFENQLAQIVAIKAQMALINTQDLPTAVALQQAAQAALEKQQAAIEAQQAIVKGMKDDIDALKAASDQWKQSLDKVLSTARKIRDALASAQRAHDALTSAPVGGEGAVSGSAAANGLRAASITINNQIDARGMTSGQLTRAAGRDLAALARARLTAGVL